MNNVDISAWGQEPPEFIRVLASIVASAGSNQAAANQIGISRSAVSTLLANKYPANTAEKERQILAFNHGKQCPVLGQISSSECQTNRQLPFLGTNPQRIALYRACRQCPNNPNNNLKKGDV